MPDKHAADSALDGEGRERGGTLAEGEEARVAVTGESGRETPWRVFDSETGLAIVQFEVWSGLTGDGGLPFAILAAGYLPCIGMRPEVPVHEVGLRPGGSVRFELVGESLRRPDHDPDQVATFELVRVAAGPSEERSSGAPIAQRSRWMAQLQDAADDATRDRVLREVLATGGELHRSTLVSGRLPLVAEGLEPGVWSYRVRGATEHLEPSVAKPFARIGENGFVSSDPALASYVREPEPQHLAPRETIVFGLQAVVRSTIVVDLPDYDSERAYANVLVRHVESLGGELRSDVEASVATRLGRVTFEDVRPGKKHVSASLRDGNTITWIDTRLERLEPGAVTYVDLRDETLGEADSAIRMRLVGDNMWSESPELESAARWEVTCILPIEGGGLDSRMWSFEGTEVVAVLRGIKPMGARFHVRPPAIPEGFQFVEEVPGKFAFDTSGRRDAEDEGERLDVTYHVRKLDRGSYCALLAGSSGMKPLSVAAQVRSGIRGRSESARRMDSSVDAPLVVPLTEGATEMVCVMQVPEGAAAIPKYYWLNLEGLDSRGGAVPVEAAATRTVTLIVSEDMIRGNSVALGVAPRASTRPYFLGLTARFEAASGGERRSAPIALPVGWFIEIAGGGGEAIMVLAEEDELRLRDH